MIFQCYHSFIRNFLKISIHKIKKKKRKITLDHFRQCHQTRWTGKIHQDLLPHPGCCQFPQWQTTRRVLEHLWVVLLKEGLVVDYNLFLFLSLSPFQQLVPLEKSEKIQIFFLLTHEHKIYITEYTQHVLGEREKEREGERKKSF